MHTAVLTLCAHSLTQNAGNPAFLIWLNQLLAIISTFASRESSEKMHSYWVMQPPFAPLQLSPARGRRRLNLRLPRCKCQSVSALKWLQRRKTLTLLQISSPFFFFILTPQFYYSPSQHPPSSSLPPDPSLWGTVEFLGVAAASGWWEEF